MRVNTFTAGAGSVVPAAGAATTASNPPIVTVTHDDGGVQVGTGGPGQPLLSVSADGRGVRGGFSYEEGFCLPVTSG